MGFRKLACTRQKQDALWAIRLDQLRQHLGDEDFLRLTTAERKSRWVGFDVVNRFKERQKKTLARLAKEKLPAEERTNDSSTEDSVSDPDSSSLSEDEEAFCWSPYHSRSQPVRKSVIEEATKPKGTKNREEYKPKSLPPDLMDYYNMCKNPDISDEVRKAKMAEVNPLFQALHRQCLDEMKPQRREKYLRRLKAAMEGDIDKVWEDNSSASESDSESDSELPPKKKKPAAARAATRVAPAKTQNRKRKTTNDGQEPAEELSTKKPAAKKSRVARGTGTARAKSNPDRLLSPPSIGSSRSVSPLEQKLRELDPNQPASTGPKKRGRPPKKAAVTNAAASASAVAATTANTDAAAATTTAATAPKKRGRCPKNAATIAAAAAVATTSDANADANAAMDNTKAPGPKKRGCSRKAPVAQA